MPAAEENQPPQGKPCATCCPACGKANQCAMALGKSPASCWCMTVSLHPALCAGLKVQFPVEACLCEDCLKTRTLTASP
ncbi:hypothetical protein HNQ59_000066 [Chitinivorax tropicus]|uniref:Cysteine-rich CWC family protein n=1 Tax=Chitinivorax tropicus TaxID=714531 RepID=A0A840MBU8_9PROT|nr:hypothetical protein [Chitinivorax tropicus]